MKILHVITRLILGGAQQNTVLSCKAQVEAGNEVHLAYGPIYGPEGSLLEEAKASGAVLHEVPTLVREVSPVKDWRCRRALTELMKSVQPDVIHTHSSKAGIVGRASGWKVRRDPELEAAWDRARRNGWRLLMRSNPRDWRPQVVHTVHGLPWNEEMSGWKRRLYVWLERYAAKRCDRLIAISPAMVDAFVGQGIAPREKFVVIPSGIDVETFFGQDLQDGQEGKLRVGLVARLDPLKGHRDLIAVLPGLVERFPELEIVFVGDGFDAEGVRAAARDAGVEERIEWRGLVPLEAMPGVYRGLDVVVLPSYQEGQSRVLAEALLGGCGIVGYYVGGIPSVCVDGQTGKLVPVGDTDALAEAIAWMLEHPAERAAMVEWGRALVQERFSAEAMNAAILKLYDDIRQEQIEKLVGGMR
ncbi:MAG: glycosyltransferase family 4 protein [Planctomycetota bacterium]